MGSRNRPPHNECERGLFHKRTWLLLSHSADQTRLAPRPSPSRRRPFLAFCVGSDPYSAIQRTLMAPRRFVHTAPLAIALRLPRALGADLSGREGRTWQPERASRF